MNRNRITKRLGVTSGTSSPLVHLSQGQALQPADRSTAPAVPITFRPVNPDPCRPPPTPLEGVSYKQSLRSGVSPLGHFKRAFEK